MIAIVIVYIYILKIIFLTDIPNNELFFICSIIFVFAIPIYIINKNYDDENSVTSKLIKVIPYLYIPFIFLQLYAMGIRIAEYGLTTSRYMACVLMIYEVIIISLAIYKKGKYLREMMLATILISVVVMISPVNFEDLPKVNQKSIVEAYIAKGVEFDNLSQEDQKKYAGAYQYIKDEYDDINLSEIEKDKLLSYNTRKSSFQAAEEKVVDEETLENIYFTKELEELDVSAYSKIIAVETLYGTTETDNVILYKNNNEKITINIQDYIGKLIEANEITKITANRLFEKDEVIVKVNESTDLYVTYVNISYSKISHQIRNFRIRGYLLEK